MRARNKFLFPAVVLTGLALSSGASGAAQSGLPTFKADVLPILAENCLMCHGQERGRADWICSRRLLCSRAANRVRRSWPAAPIEACSWKSWSAGRCRPARPGFPPRASSASGTGSSAAPPGNTDWTPVWRTRPMLGFPPSARRTCCPSSRCGAWPATASGSKRRGWTCGRGPPG